MSRLPTWVAEAKLLADATTKWNTITQDDKNNWAIGLRTIRYKNGAWTGEVVAHGFRMQTDAQFACLSRQIVPRMTMAIELLTHTVDALSKLACKCEPMIGQSCDVHMVVAKLHDTLEKMDKVPL